MYQAILFLPLAGALFAGLLGPFAGPRASEVVATTLLLIAALLSWVGFYEVAPENWIGVGGRYGKQFRAFTERYPFVCHGLSLSIGAPAP